MDSPEESGTVPGALRRYHYERCTDFPEEENPYLNSDLCGEIQKELDDEEKRRRLHEAGWHPWYNADYWVNPKTVQNPKIQDYTNYGMPLEKAWAYELNNEQPSPPVMHSVERALDALRSARKSDKGSATSSMVTNGGQQESSS